MPSPQLLAALDHGTTSTRLILFDRAGVPIASAQREHRQLYPHPGFVEHDPNEIWRNTLAVLEEACATAGIQAYAVAALGLTNQRETTVLWNRHTGQPISNALVWQDTRVGTLVEHFAADGGPDRLRAATGLPLATYFSALKIRWLLDNVAGAREAATHGDLLFGNLDSFLLWHLTGGPNGGVHLTDVTNASRTQLMHLDTLAWDPELLRLFDIPASLLPAIRPSTGLFGEIRVGALAGVPVTGMLGDQHAAMVGQTCFHPGDVKNTYGTGCFLLMNTGPRRVDSTHGLLTTVAYQFAGQPPVYALEGSIAITGALVQWLRDNLRMISTLR